MNIYHLIDFNRTKTILFFGLIFRLIAAVFSEGYGMHDDHFLIVEAAGSWVDGFDYNHWLPGSPGNIGPEGHSFTYVGLNYIIFWIAKFFGISNPYWMMVFNRIFHALWSMLIIVYAIKIAEKMVNRAVAVRVGWVLALLWIAPFISVRNLVEYTSIPVLMIGFWYLIREKKKTDFLIAGIWMGIAVSFRYQIGVFLVGLAAYYFFKAQWKVFFQFCIGVLLSFAFFQGFVDYCIWGYPFAEFWAYTSYNMVEGTAYMKNSNYFMYIYVLFGVLLFPLGLLAIPAYFASWKKYTILFVPTFLFLLFHSFYPNRQERFIVTILPFVLITCFAILDHWKQKGRFGNFYKWSWKAFWVLNIPLLLFFTITSSKVSRVESMSVLYNDGLENEFILMEASGGEGLNLPPRFYGKAWNCQVVERTSTDEPLTVNGAENADYIFFVGKERLIQRIQDYMILFPNMELKRKCEPSLLDGTLHKLNPRNSNEYIEVWETNIR
ncbi:MAG: glycosyltransferase family 39 protein [Bacteroidetes bacterium]|nr:glycosyltransferase family 39 protein [Bacteroidota bacterium]